jgi:hypothetical protein
MLAPAPMRIPSAARTEHQACPACALALTLTHNRQGTTICYDVDSWARLCTCTERDGPLACPWVERQLWAWLSPAA